MKWINVLFNIALVTTGTTAVLLMFHYHSTEIMEQIKKLL